MPRNKIATKNIEGTVVTITFSNNETVTVDLRELSDEMKTNLALHGLSQKVGDSYSGESEIAVAKTKAQGVVERLMNGDWKAVRESSGAGRITDLAQALANITGRTIEEATQVVDAMDKGQKSKLRKHPEIAAEVLRISAERAAAKVKGSDGVDLDAIMAA